MSSQIQYQPGDNTIVLLRKILTRLNEGISSGGSGGGGSVEFPPGFIQNIKAFTRTPTLITSGYSFNTAVGTVWEVPVPTSGFGSVHGLTIIDAEGKNAGLEFIVVNGTIVSTVQNGSAVTWDTADYPKIRGRLAVTSTDYEVEGSSAPSIAQTGGYLIPVDFSQGLRIICLAKESVQYTTTSSLTVVLHVMVPHED